MARKSTAKSKQPKAKKAKAKKPDYPRGFKPNCFMPYRGQIVPALRTERPGQPPHYILLVDSEAESEGGFKRVRDKSRQFELYKLLLLWKYRQAVRSRDKRSVYAIATRMYLSLRNYNFFIEIQFEFVQGRILLGFGHSPDDCEWFALTVGELNGRLFNPSRRFIPPPIPVGADEAAIALIDKRQKALEARCRKRFGMPPDEPPEGGCYNPENYKAKSRKLRGWKEVPETYTRWQLRMM